MISYKSNQSSIELLISVSLKGTELEQELDLVILFFLL